MTYSILWSEMLIEKNVYRKVIQLENISGSLVYRVIF